MGWRWRDICEELDVSQQTISRVLKQAGGDALSSCRSLPGPVVACLSVRRSSRPDVCASRSPRSLGVLARSTSTVSREVNENRWAWSVSGVGGGSSGADDRGRCGPNPTKLSQLVSPDWSRTLRTVSSSSGLRSRSRTAVIDEFSDDPEMRVSPETIYKELFVQGRGSLRKELRNVPDAAVEPGDGPRTSTQWWLTARSSTR